jgi:hypothetical protein
MRMITTPAAAAGLREQTRAGYPDEAGFAERDGVRVCWERYGAGRCMDYDTATPDVIAQAISDEIGKQVSCRDVETDGAARAGR